MSQHHPDRNSESHPSNIARPSLRDMADLLEACTLSGISPAHLVYLLRHDPATVRWALSRHTLTASSGVYEAADGIKQQLQDVDVPHSVRPELVDSAVPQLQKLIENIKMVGVPLEPGIKQPVIETPLTFADFQRLAQLEYIQTNDFASASNFNLNGKFASALTADGKKINITLDKQVLSTMSSLESL